MTTASLAPRREDTRRRILDVALELIAENGFAATSTRELSERMGFTKAALYYHFHTKDDLLAALVAPALDGLAGLTQGDENPTPSVAARRALLSRYVDFVAANKRLLSVLSQDPAMKQGPGAVAAKQHFERLSQRLAGTELLTTLEQVRVRSALGGINATLLHPWSNDDPAIIRWAAIVAACGALGIPPGRPTN